MGTNTIIDCEGVAEVHILNMFAYGTCTIWCWCDRRDDLKEIMDIDRRFKDGICLVCKMPEIKKACICGCSCCYADKEGKPHCSQCPCGDENACKGTLAT